MALFRFYEKKGEKVIASSRFVKRLIQHFLAAIAVISFSLAVGAAGYHYSEGMSWMDAVYNASMILTGMGPVSVLTNDGAKLFASLYALYSGFVILTITAMILAPVVHRILHAFHIDENE